MTTILFHDAQCRCDGMQIFSLACMDLPSGRGDDSCLHRSSVELEVLTYTDVFVTCAAMCEITIPLRLCQCRSDNQKHLLCRRLQGGKKSPALPVDIHKL